MKRKLSIIRNLSLAAVAALVAVACIRDNDYRRPASDEVSVHFRIRTPRPTPVDTRAVDIESAVNNIALLVFQQEGGAGEFLYRYAAMGQITSQEDGTEAEMCGNGIRCFAKYAYERGHGHAQAALSPLFPPFRASPRDTRS